MKKLDLTPRSVELLARAYDLAGRVYARAPWTEMEERQLLAVELKDGRRRILSVMGEQGTHLAIAIYPSKAEFGQLNTIANDDVDDLRDAFFGSNHLQLAFGPASELQEGEMKDVRASGVKFKRGVNPSFVTYVAGFAPARMGGEELVETIDVIEAFLAYIDRFGTASLPIVLHAAQPLTTWTEDASGVWKKGENDCSFSTPVVITMNDALVAEVAALPVDNNRSLEIGAFVMPIGRGADKRGKMSRVLLIVDENTGMLIGTQIFSAPDDAEFDWSETADFVLDTFVRMKARPKRLAVFGRHLHAVFKDLTRNSFPGTEFDDDSFCDSVRDAFNFVSQRF